MWHPRDTQRGTPVVSRGRTQLKVGLRVRNLEASCALYLKLGFKQIPRRPRRSRIGDVHGGLAGETAFDRVDEVRPQVPGLDDPIHGAHGQCPADAVNLVELPGHVAKLLRADRP